MEIKKMEKIKIKIEETKVWFKENYNFVITILFILLCSSHVQILKVEAQLESCAASTGKTTLDFKLPKID
jgi:hypothetical protein